MEGGEKEMDNEKPLVPLKVGDMVVYHDSKGKAHLALVLIVWEPCGQYGSINLVYVSPDEAEQDTYGRQIKRDSSVQHVSQVNTHGNYWRLVTEPINPVVKPEQK